MVGNFSGPILKTTLHFPYYEFVHIVCYSSSVDKIKLLDRKTRTQGIIHDQIIPLIPRVEKSSDSNAPNILLMKIDSMSFVNFKRLFIKTGKLLTEQNFIELKGYTKVGSNTIPNMIPLLTGYHPFELTKKFKKSKKVGFDKWPIIWKDYSERGFVTTFVEEMPAFSIFRDKSKRFRKKPTDYFTRPFVEEIISRRYNGYCYGDTTKTETQVHFLLPSRIA